MKKLTFIFLLISILLSCSKKDVTNNYWDNIYEKAKKEKNVTIYSYSSRIFKAIEDFNNYYPEIEVIAFDITENEIIDLINKDIETGQTNLDVLFTSNANLIRNNYKDYFINYIPPVLLDNIKTTEVINDNLLNPSLTQSIELNQILYNIEKYPDKAPIDNLWDLTRKKWEGKIYLKNPLLNKSFRMFINKIIYESTLMKTAYLKEFGKNPKFNPGIENAGYEWVYRFFNNNPIFTTSSGFAAKVIGIANQSDPPIGIAASTKLRYNKKGYKLGIAWDVFPVSGYSKKIILNIAKNSKKPNAAKLLTAWLLGYKNGEGGIKPFNINGQLPSRKDIQSTNLNSKKILEKTWLIDYDTTYSPEIEDFWLKYLKQY